MGSVLRAPSPTDAVLEGGFGRNSSSERPDVQPRIPLIRVDAGCIPGTRPGCSAAELERAGRDLVRSRLHRNRFKPA